MNIFKLVNVTTATMFAFALLAGCASEKKLTEIPVSTNFKSESMMKLQSVSHWNNVAVDMATDVATKYSSGNGCIPGYGCKTPIYVKEVSPETNFSKAFYTQLISALVNQGFPVRKQDRGQGTTVEIDIQVVNIEGRQSKIEYDQMPAELTEGVWVIRDVASTGVQKFKSNKTNQWTQGETSNSIWFKSPQDAPAAEMLVTVSFVNDSQYIARTSNVYYLSATNGYVVPQPVAAPPVVAASAAEVVAPKNVWSVRVVGDCAPERCFKN